MSSQQPTHSVTTTRIGDILAKRLGKEWRHLRSGDLIRFKNGRLVLVTQDEPVSGEEGAKFEDGITVTGDLGGPCLLWFYEFVGDEVPVLRGDDPNNPNPEYLRALDEFVQKICGKR